MKAALRALITFAGLLLAWAFLVRWAELPHYILPGPDRVAARLWSDRALLADHALMTLAEVVLGLLLGTVCGVLAALALMASTVARRWLLPLLLVSQAVPVFAIAPLLVLWLGYGMASKVAMATLIIFFPVTAAFYDGLRRTDPGWLDLARTMGASPWMLLRHIRGPAALPALGAGLRVAAAVAPIGAVVGEWVGASSGLGYLMLHATARVQTDLTFAALFLLALLAVALWLLVDLLLRRALPWLPDSHGFEG
ncbi:ABC transporter permease [Niveispirillum sp. BGYR6]|uniref:ABC transporter permease n=1 Tax=Niveispirillum sp. BGYR6 TaxID=2971249 RepID=UPI0022B99C52|nr:ABC transporter permease [Niveispirillum sp. BGYR6]MDG5495260.1 ABC transporter permease [Niveispirillum sp. BGYR6]